MVAFCRSDPDPRVVDGLADERNQFTVDGRHVHWRIHGTVSTSGIALDRLSRALGGCTTRSMTTLRKLTTLPE